MKLHLKPRQNKEYHRAKNHTQQIIGLYGHNILNYSNIKLVNKNNKYQNQRDKVSHSSCKLSKQLTKLLYISKVSSGLLILYFSSLYQGSSKSIHLVKILKELDTLKESQYSQVLHCNSIDISLLVVIIQYHKEHSHW